MATENPFPNLGEEKFPYLQGDYFRHWWSWISAELPSCCGALLFRATIVFTLFPKIRPSIFSFKIAISEIYPQETYQQNFQSAVDTICSTKKRQFEKIIDQLKSNEPTHKIKRMCNKAIHYNDKVKANCRTTPHPRSHQKGLNCLNLKVWSPGISPRIILKC
ncbi:uncharacterized protein BYT42DRAFT_635595 [Radiomyces spectabilis]|uniref:uncharacterized protein n=1 Tax=Radiomyces spectabilis TaxID=64574 RepID=UPI00221F08CC|nr:uncharacterized protein BYT42DRAFT_635595 [Radiomyces spectabilis]KAI8379365.1 hypothetical protein BYT42DRAFT_635595 [Radiomyces spectabilis]